MKAYISCRFAHVTPCYHGHNLKRWMEMETLTTSSEHRRHDAAASTDSTPPHGQYRGGAQLLCPMPEMWQCWGKPWPLVKGESSEIMWPLLSRIMYSCERLLQHCSTAGQAAAGHLGLTWLQPDCRSSCRTIAAVIQICNYNQDCSTICGVLQLHSNCHSKSQHDCQTKNITNKFLENISFADEE